MPFDPATERGSVVLWSHTYSIEELSPMIFARRGHQSLMPLTNQHHRALAQARRLRLAAHDWEEERRSAVNAFLQSFETNTIPHFRAEEQAVIPLMINEPDAIVQVMRLMSAHIQVDAFVRQFRHKVANSAPPNESMISLARMFEAEIRFEEEVVFPMIERVVIDGSAQLASGICGRCGGIHTDRDVNGEAFATCIPCQAKLVEVALQHR